MLKPSDLTSVDRARVWFDGIDRKLPQDANKMFVLAGDIETSGTHPFKHGVVEVGFSILDAQTGTPVIEFDSGLFALYKGRGWDRDTEAWWRKNHSAARYREAHETKQSPQGVADAVVVFLQTAAAVLGQERLVPVLDTSVFDGMFLSVFLCEHGYPPLDKILGAYRCWLDTDSYHQGAAGDTPTVRRRQEGYSPDTAIRDELDRLVPTQEAEAYGLPPWPSKQSSTHVAVDDARSIGKLHVCVVTRLDYVSRWDALRARRAENRALRVLSVVVVLFAIGVAMGWIRVAGL